MFDCAAFFRFRGPITVFVQSDETAAILDQGAAHQCSGLVNRPIADRFNSPRPMSSRGGVPERAQDGLVRSGLRDIGGVARPVSSAGALRHNGFAG